MTQDTIPTTAIVPSTQVQSLSNLSATPDTREQLSCKALLVGDTLARAQAEAADVLPKMEENRQVLSVFGTDALESMNRLTDRMLHERRSVDVPEINDIMHDLSRRMRGLGKKYDPNDDKARERYKQVKGGIMHWFHFGKTFLEEFMDDVRSMEGQFDLVVEKLNDKKEQLDENTAYFDEFYRLNEEEIAKLIYKIGVMEIMRDMLADKASKIVVGDANLGDRGAEEKAKMTELVTLLESKITAFKAQLWSAWVMAPQTRNISALSVGMAQRVDQTIYMIINDMKRTIVIWRTLGDAEQARLLNEAVEQTYNQVMAGLAEAAKVTVPAIANALAQTALDPRTIVAWRDSLVAQADGFIQAEELGKQKRAELEAAMIESKQIVDAATERVNQARLEHVLSLAKDAPLEIATSVPAAPAAQN